MELPEKGSRKWIENERKIAHTPELRRLRDESQGLSGSSGRTYANGSSQAYRDGWDRIFGKKDTDK